MPLIARRHAPAANSIPELRASWYPVAGKRSVESDGVGMDFAALKSAIALAVVVGPHGREGLRKHSLTLDAVRISIDLNGSLLEDYPNDRRGPSCLVLSYPSDGRPVHSAWAWDGTNDPFLITVYRPGPPKFTPDGRTGI